MATPWIALVAIGSWLLLLQVGQSGPEMKAGKGSSQQRANIAQERARAPEESNATVENDEQETPITAKAGKFAVTVTKADAIDQMKLGRKTSSNPAADMLLEQLQNGSATNSSNNFQRNEQFFGGNGNASGSSGGASGGFASGSGSTSGSVTSGGNSVFVRPNLAVALKVDSNDKAIFELENMQAVDDRGNPVQWMGPGAFVYFDPAFEKGLKGEVLAYFQEENDTEYLTISGELKVTPGRRHEVEFSNGKPSTKKSGEHSFVLKDLQSNERGIHVELSLPQLIKKRGNQFGNPQAMMKAVLEQQAAFEVLVQDSEGELHSPGASGSAGGSSSASGSGGGTFVQEAQSNSTQSFTFAGLPDGREIKSVIVRATERTGKPQSYPFKLPRVPVPYGIN